jgi:hypothetical protein
VRGTLNENGKYSAPDVNEKTMTIVAISIKYTYSTVLLTN